MKLLFQSAYGQGGNTVVPLVYFSPNGGETLNLTSHDTLERGDRGQDIKDLQKILIDQLQGNHSDNQNFQNVQNAINSQNGGFGKFGPATEALVKLFQRENNLNEDGIVGKDVKTAILQNQTAGALQDFKKETDPTTTSVRSDTEVLKGRQMMQHDRIDDHVEGYGSSMQDVKDSADRFKEALGKSEKLREYEEAMIKTMEKAIDGGFIEGGVLGGIGSLLQAASGSTKLNNNLTNIAKEHGVSDQVFKQNWTSMVGKYEKALGKDARFLRNDNKYFKQNRKYAAKDLAIILISSAMGTPTIPLGHLKTGIITGITVVPNINEQGSLIDEASATKRHIERIEAGRVLNGTALDVMKNYKNALEGQGKVDEREHSVEMREMVNILNPIVESLGYSINAQGKMYKKKGHTARKLAFDFLENPFKNLKTVGLIEKSVSKNTPDTKRMEAAQKALTILREELQSDAQKIEGKLILDMEPGKNEDNTEIVGKTIVQHINLVGKGKQNLGGNPVKAIWSEGSWEYSVNGKNMTAQQIAEKASGKTKGLFYNNVFKKLSLSNPVTRARKTASLKPRNLSENKRNKLRAGLQERRAQLKSFERTSTILESSLQTRKGLKNTKDVAESQDPYKTAVHSLLATFPSYKDFVGSGMGASVSKNLSSKIKNYYEGTRNVDGGSIKMLNKLAKDSEFKSWADAVSKYSRGEKGALQAKMDAVNNEQRVDRSNEYTIGKKCSVPAYGANISKIKRTDELQYYLNNANRKDGKPVLHALLSQLNELTGNGITRNSFLAQVAHAKRIHAEGINTGTSTKRGGGSKYAGDMWVLDIPIKYKVTTPGGGGTIESVLKVGIKDSCSNLVLIEEKTKATAGVEIPNEAYIAKHWRVPLAIPTNFGGSSGGGGGSNPNKFDSITNTDSGVGNGGEILIENGNTGAGAVSVIKP